MLTLMAFGGPQAHLALFLDRLVKKRGYITEDELIELNSFCQILPGPASTQTLTAIGFKIGGPRLAFLTLLVWIFPACFFMTAIAVVLEYLKSHNISIEFARYMQPVAIGFVMFAAYKIGLMVVRTMTAYVIFVVSAVFCYFVDSPAIFPLLLLICGVITAFKYKGQPKQEKKEKWKIEWANLFLYFGIFAAAAIIGNATNYFPLLLFENFFRNGSLIFGGGDALSAYFFKEFVEFKQYLSREELLTGYAIQKALPGPLFAFSSFVGALSMRHAGVYGEIWGGIIAAAGIFLPGTILIFFMIRIWNKLKEYRVVRASLEGINAASAGIVTATALVMIDPIMVLPNTQIAIHSTIIAATVTLLVATKIPPSYIILSALLAGFIL